MVCQACGTVVAEGVHFCSKCGAQVAFAQPMYAAYPPAVPMLVPRVQRNLQTLGILWCVFGLYRVVMGLAGMFFLRAFTMRGFTNNGWPFGGSFGPSFLSSLLPFIAVYTAVMAALALFVGYSLLTRRPWGRTLAIVVGVLTLFKFFLGTALGIYTLWVLAPATSGLEYDSIADQS